MKLPPLQLLLPLSACGGKEERKEEEKESPGMRCLCSGQVMREIFLSFLKEGKSCSWFGEKRRCSPPEAEVLRRADPWEPGAADVQHLSLLSLFSLSVSFLLSLHPEEPRLEGGPGDRALHPGLKPCHTSVSWQQDVLLQILHSVPCCHSWEPLGLSYRVGTDT